MNPNNDIIEITKEYVKTALKDAEGGHDWFHILRVYNNAKLIAKKENVNHLVVELAALLHDIADSKFYNGDDSIGPQRARHFLNQHNVDKITIDHVLKIIENISFNKSLEPGNTFTSNELHVVQDADRLDAIGAIGIARCFNYGGYKHRKLYDPSILPKTDMTREEYKTSTAPTINHFYEKLLKISETMKTETGKEIAKKRHLYMESFLAQFYSEWHGKD